jgi:hypothetical protein
MWLWQLAKQLRALPPLVGIGCAHCGREGWYTSAVVCDPRTNENLCAGCAIDYAKRGRAAKRDMEQAVRNAQKEGAQ